MTVYYFLSILILLVAVLLGLIVLVQNSKGGGLASNFSSSNQFMGVRKTADFLEKATWTLASTLLLLCLLTIFVIPRNQAGNVQSDTELRQMINENAAPIQDFTASPSAPAVTPQPETQQAPQQQPAQQPQPEQPAN